MDQCEQKVKVYPCLWLPPLQVTFQVAAGYSPWYIGGGQGVDSQSKQRHLKERRSGVSHPGAPGPLTLGQPPWTSGPCSKADTLGSPKGEDLQPEYTSQSHPGLIGLTPWTYRALLPVRPPSRTYLSLGVMLEPYARHVM